MAASRVLLVLSVCGFIAGGAATNRSLISPEMYANAQIWNDLPEGSYSACCLNNSRTGSWHPCAYSEDSSIDNCNTICMKRAWPDITRTTNSEFTKDIWNVIGTLAFDISIQTAFEAQSGDSPLRRKRRIVQYSSEKLPNLGYNSCILQNDEGITIYCKSTFPWMEDEVDCNDACEGFVNSVYDTDKIKGEWTLIGKFYSGEERQTGFKVIVGEHDSEYETGDENASTTEMDTEYASTTKTDIEYASTTETRRDASIGGRIHHLLPDSTYSSCSLNNTRTGEIHLCKESDDSSIKDCNDECLSYFNIHRTSIEFTKDIWNLIGIINFDPRSTVQTAFEAQNLDLYSWQNRRVEYNPNKLPNLGYSSCRLQNVAGVTIYCKSYLPWVEENEVDCNDACQSIVDSLMDANKIKGDWTLVGQFYHGEERQTGFKVIADDAAAESATTEVEPEYTQTREISADTIEPSLDDVASFKQLSPDGRIVVNIPRKVRTWNYRLCQLNTTIRSTFQLFTCSENDQYDVPVDCNVECLNFVLNNGIYSFIGMWNLVATKFYDFEGIETTGFEVADARGTHLPRSVRYPRGKLSILPFSSCWLQESLSDRAIQCSTKQSGEFVDCNLACEAFVERVVDIESFVGPWTIAGQFMDVREETDFEIMLAESPEKSTPAPWTSGTSSLPPAAEALTNGNSPSDDVKSYSQFSPDGRLLINIPRQLPVGNYRSCQLNTTRTWAIEIFNCSENDRYDVQIDCNVECSNYVLRNNIDKFVGMWNLVGIKYYGFESIEKTGFEVTEVRRSYPLGSVRYPRGKLSVLYFSSCRLQDSIAERTIQCSIAKSRSLVDCNLACETFVKRVANIENIVGPWTIIGQFMDVSVEKDFEIVLDESPEASTPEPGTSGTSSAPPAAEALTNGNSSSEHCSSCGGPRTPTDQSTKVVVEMPGPLAADQDLHFALSLVPMLRQRSLRDKLDTEIDILSYFRSQLVPSRRVGERRNVRPIKPRGWQ